MIEDFEELVHGLLVQVFQVNIVQEIDYKELGLVG